MRPLLLIFCVAGTTAVYTYAQSAMEVPGIGAIVDSLGSLRPVQGVAGSFLLGPASVMGVLSAACSEQMCLVKTDSKILSATGETDAPTGPALFGMSGDEALVFFPKVRTFARWHNDVLDPLDWEIDGEILSIRATQIAVRKDSEVSVVSSDDATIDSITDASGPVLLLPKGVVFATSDEVVLRQDDAEVRFSLAGAESITAMGPRYAAIRAGDAIYALRTDPGREGLYRLPGSAP